jgi:hypothetical protein
MSMLYLSLAVAGLTQLAGERHFKPSGWTLC